MLFKYVLKFRGSNYLQFETTVLKDFLDFSIQITDDISLFMRKKKFKMYNVYYKVRIGKNFAYYCRKQIFSHHWENNFD